MAGYLRRSHVAISPVQGSHLYKAFAMKAYEPKVCRAGRIYNTPRPLHQQIYMSHLWIAWLLTANQCLLLQKLYPRMMMIMMSMMTPMMIRQCCIYICTLDCPGLETYQWVLCHVLYCLVEFSTSLSGSYHKAFLFRLFSEGCRGARFVVCCVFFEEEDTTNNDLQFILDKRFPHTEAK